MSVFDHNYWKCGSNMWKKKNILDMSVFDNIIESLFSFLTFKR